MSEFAIPEIAVCAPPAVAPEIVIAFPAWESDVVPARQRHRPRGHQRQSAGRVPGEGDATTFWVWTVWAGAPIEMVLPLVATVTAPTPDREETPPEVIAP